MVERNGRAQREAFQKQANSTQVPPCISAHLHIYCTKVLLYMFVCMYAFRTYRATHLAHIDDVLQASPSAVDRVCLLSLVAESHIAVAVTLA